MGSFYRLQIHSDAEQKHAVELLLGSSTDDPGLDWGWVIDEESPRFPHAIPLFLDAIARHGDALAQLGLSAEQFTVWYCYEYEGQCNMEFGPALTKRMGELGVTLCVSCWEK